MCFNPLKKSFQRIMEGWMEFCCQFANSGELQSNAGMLGIISLQLSWWLNCCYFMLRIASYSSSYARLFRIIISFMSLIIVSPCCHNMINNIRAHLPAGVQTNFKLSSTKYCHCSTLCTLKFESTALWQSQLLNNEGWMRMLNLACPAWKHASQSNSQCAGPDHTSQHVGAFAGPKSGSRGGRAALSSRLQHCVVPEV